MSSAPKITRGADERVAEPGLADDLLNPGLASKVRERRVLRRVRDAEVHDAIHSSLAGRLDEGLVVGDGAVERDLPVREPHPIGVVQGLRPAEMLRQLPPVLEVERHDLDPIPERVRPGGVAGERPHALPASRRRAVMYRPV
jgi:hypothetical protein